MKKNGKVNFVDINNVFVGFDYESSCCERFGYCITDKIPTRDIMYISDTQQDLESYIFDTEYCQYIYDSKDSDLAAVAFKLVSEGKPDLFLILYNSHNGYYSHGFQMKMNEHLLYGDSL